MTATHSRQAAYDIDPRFTQRWSRRSFQDKALTEKELFTILEAARWAPSGSNVQPWRFVYGIKGTPAWQNLLDGIAPRNQLWANKAGALVAFVSTPSYIKPDGESAETRSASFDAGAAWISAAFQAQALGLNTRAMGGLNYDKLSSLLNLPENHRVEVIIAIGHPGTKDDLPADFQGMETPTPRKPLSDIAFEGKFKA